MHNLSISEQLTYCTVRIECELKGGLVGTGTGFFFKFLENNETGECLPVVITNKHVVRDSLKGRIIFTKATPNMEPKDKEHFKLQLENFESLWRFHPDPNVDLCAMPIAPYMQLAESMGDKLFYIPFSKEMLPTDKQKSDFSALEDILMIGYPNGIWDSVNNMPILRKGSTATHPNFDYDGKKEIMIDIAAFPGSSGSPVLIFNESGYRDKHGNFFMGASRVILLGILYAGPQATATGEIIMAPESQRPIAVSMIPNNLGVIIKSERILELETLFK